MLSLVQAKQWEQIIALYNPQEVCDVISFKESGLLARSLFSIKASEEMLNFAVELLFACSKRYPKEWDSDWKFDVYLAGLCSAVWRYQDAYRLYRRAYDRIENPPTELLLRLAGCASYASIEPEISISKEEARTLIERAWQKEQTYNGALGMRSLARANGDFSTDKWDEICARLKHIVVHPIVPDMFKREEET